jgi:formate hydrogenlyase subunit 6/NADH:ubiquinone oxidoreductase subunit I
MTAETDTYRRLQKHLDSMPVGYPATRSGVELDLLRAVFTPAGARIAAHLDYKHKTLDEIYAAAKGEVGSKEELARILDQTVAKGGITRRKRGGQTEYAVLPLLLWGMYERQIQRLDADYLDRFGEYMMGEFALELATTRLPKMRVIPIEESVEAERHIATYDELRHLIEQAGDHIAVQKCICRTVNDLQGKHCQATDRRELCMSLGDLADLYVEEGWGRRLTRQEALDTARRNEEEGLVLMCGNEQETAFICACCSDCCGMLTIMTHVPRPADAVASNHFVQVDVELCTTCGECVERCPTGAVTTADAAAVVDLTRCIGCGLCVPTCSADAMLLVKKAQEVVPPRTEEDLYDTIMAQKSTLVGRARDYLLKSFLRISSRFSR